jgi:hypothetical protein
MLKDKFHVQFLVLLQRANPECRPE